VSPPTVSIRYRRLPQREEVHHQRLVEDAGEYVVSLLDAAEITRPMEIQGTVVLEPGSPIVWFTYPGRWYDVGRFHRADGTFTGFYANILTPVDIDGLSWTTTDLCLDVWMSADGSVDVLDEDEFAAAVDAGWIDSSTAAIARETAETLALLARQGDWPQPHLFLWTLERVRSLLASPGGEAASPHPARK
jgi:predicted RNA-binding protein associated with RNAse of E/G family